MMQHYNLELIKAMADGDEAFIQEMVETFLEELPEDIQMFNQAVENQNARMAFEISHKFKPNLKMFGIDLSKQIKNVEEWSNGEFKYEDIKYYAKEIILTVEEACKEMKAEFKLD